MERYSEYKDSGVKWLGEIPSHWEVMPIKHSYKFTVGWTPPTGRNDLFEGNNLWANISDLGKKEINNTANRISDSAVRLSGRSMSPKGSLLYSFKLSVGTVSFCGADMYTNEAIATFLKGKNSLEYLYYAAPIFIIKNANTNIYGAPILNQDLIKNALVLLPPRTEQDAIVRYLDAATSKIDKAIAMQQKMIDLLNERKQIIIQNAVTKGLDENVEMKDSGVEWIGMIPKHWKIIRIKHLAKLQSGSNLTSNEISDTGSYPVYGGNGLRGFYGSYNCEGSHVLIGRQGALCGNINYAEDKFWATEHAVVCYPKKKYNTLWFGEILRLMNLGQYSLASAQPGLAVERIKGLYMPYPSIEEQNKIALFLKQNIGKIDLYARHCQRQITLLQERKQIIINEVVTGKVKVS